MSFDQMTLWEKELPCGKTQPAISSKQAECVCEPVQKGSGLTPEGFPMINLRPYFKKCPSTLSLFINISL